MNSSREPFIFELKTYDGRSWPLTQRYYDLLKEKMRQQVKLLEMPDNSLIAVSNIAGITKRQMTMADMPGDQKRLPQGEIKFDPNGKGYKIFLEAWKKTNPQSYSKHISKLAERSDDEGYSSNTGVQP